ncbi:hypothetical protein F7D34_05840 [Prevotella copri]|uniref:Uncharacterized protein n=1 Tax=Segatella copri TaxID=165179 RepID=A0A646HGC0_9BACT|nr:hypothetical protein [Segatella copri]MQN89962.1 hypothetical protein [Segatella copri]MQO77499.1 hypothetical protein [Segatella copri]
MKKLLTLVAAAFMAVSVFAQSGTPLELKGGWNAGFAGDADVYDFTISKLYGAAEFACNVNSADYPRYILEFEDPLPDNFQVNYTWKTSADAEGEATPAYGRAKGDGKTKKFELYFDQEHPYIVGVGVQHTDDKEVNLKVKKMILVAADGTEKKIDASFTGWAGTDNTVYYKGMVSFNDQWQQLMINDVAGKKDLTIKVQLEKPTPNVQMCVAYEEGEPEYYQFTGTNKATFNTRKDGVVKTIGIQYTDEKKIPLSVNVDGAWLVEKESVHIGTNGWATFASDCAVKYDDLGLEAYAVKLNDDKVSFTKLTDVVPAYTPVLLKGTADTDYEVNSNAGWAPYVPTDLKASDGTSASTDAATLYALSTVNDVTAFYPVKKDSKIPAKRCYLEVKSTSPKAAFYSLGTNFGETTGISSVENKVEKADAPVYNLAGQLVGKDYKGLVIKNGKKFVIK